MGLDIGDSRIGVALSDPLGILASPLKIIVREDSQGAIQDIIDIVGQYKVGRIIVGMPVSMDGTIGKQAEKVRDFAMQLRNHTEVPVVFKDERLSTVVAKRLIKGVRKTHRDTRYDAAAAALILQRYLDDTAYDKNRQE
jgi:putative Holliday junction resolvase